MPLMLMQSYTKMPPPWPVAAVIVGLLIANVMRNIWKDRREGRRVDYIGIVVIVALLIAMLVYAIAENRPY